MKKYSKTGTASAAAAAASAKKGGKRKTRKQLQLEKKQRQKEEDEELEKIRLERLLEENQPTQGEKLRKKDRDALALFISLTKISHSVASKSIDRLICPSYKNSTDGF